MGDPTKFYYIWEYNLFNFALLMLFISEIFIFVYAHGKKDRKEISRDRGTKWLLYFNFIVCIFISFYNVSKKAFDFIRMMKFPGFCIELGIGLMLLGIVIRISAVLTLRKAFTLNVQVTSRQRMSRQLAWEQDLRCLLPITELSILSFWKVRQIRTLMMDLSE